MVGIATLSEWRKFRQVVKRGVMASRSGDSGAAVPDAEQLDAVSQIFDVGWIELKVYNLGAHCRRDERCRVVRCTLYAVRCTLYAVRCTLYAVRCTVHGARYTQPIDHRGASNGILVGADGATEAGPGFAWSQMMR
jgi:hypothetical protein